MAQLSSFLCAWLRLTCIGSCSAQASALSALLLTNASLCFSDILFDLASLPFSSSVAALSHASSASITARSRSDYRCCSVCCGGRGSIVRTRQPYALRHVGQRMTLANVGQGRTVL